jgi:hypothetical protein
VFCLVVLPVVRVLMVWAYDLTESVLLSVLMHLSLTPDPIAGLGPETSAQRVRAQAQPVG